MLVLLQQYVVLLQQSEKYKVDENGLHLTPLDGYINQSKLDMVIGYSEDGVFFDSD